MSIKRIVILSIIVVLAAVLIIQRFVDFSRTPEIETWEGNPDRVTIVRPSGSSADDADSGTIILEREGSEWTVTEDRFPADGDTVSTLVDMLRDITLLDVISRNREYARFELDDEQAVRVTVEKDGETVMDLLIGKASPTNRQSYVKPVDRNEVYLASENLRRQTDKEILAFRDKHIFGLDENSIDKVTVEYEGEEYTVVKEDAEGVFRLTGDSEVELDQDKVKNLLRAFSNVNARDFPKEANGLKQPVCIAQAFEGTKSVSISIFPKEEEENEYKARASETPYVFTLSTYQAERFMKKTEDLAKD